MSNLLIVESPHKAQTIQQWFGSDWVIIATAGHIVNLPKNDYGIDSQYNGEWKLIHGKKDIIQKLRHHISNAAKIFIGTDDDREGERIAYDLVEYFKIKDYYRVIFHEITRSAVSSSLKNAIYIDENKVNAQKARRIIDRIIGYPITSGIRYYFKTSKTLTEEAIKKIGIGRVSAAALGLIVRNEYKIENFIPSKYKKIYMDYIYDGLNFSVTNNIKFKKENSAELEEMYKLLLDKDTVHSVESYNNKLKEIPPYPPLTTTRILRSMNYLYGYDPKDTMAILQKLYDGVEIDGKRIGLITYPRTDSLNFSDEAVNQIISFLFFIAEQNQEKLRDSNLNPKYRKMLFDETYIVDTKREFKNKNDNAFEAHEAIRPTMIEIDYAPKNLKNYLNNEEFKVYEFIFYRTVSTQMKNAIYDVSNIVIDAGGNKFQAYANQMVFDGWEILLGTKIKKSEDQEDMPERLLPSNISIGDELNPVEVYVDTRDEKTPPRYGIGRFITTLEANNIGRPSTIADITIGLKNRGLITIVKNMIIPTEVGKKLYAFLEEHANWLIDLEHTMEFENNLDRIEKGDDYVPLIQEYDTLKNTFLSGIGYDVSDKPAEWLVEKAKKIAAEQGETLSPRVLADKKKLFQYYNDYKKSIKVGKCLLCKKSDVVEYENIFKCSSYDCKFFVTKESIVKFFDIFAKEISPQGQKLFMQHILKTKKVWVHDLHSKKKEKTFGAFVVLEKNGNYYNLQLSFSKTKMKTIDEKYVFDSFFERIEEPEKSKSTDTSETETETKFINLEEKKVSSSEIEKLKKEKRLLEEQANKDKLTRSYNRHKFDTDIQNIDSNNILNDVTIAFIDGDKFKAINDTYGHQVGDFVLTSLVDCIFRSIRDRKINVYRYGGEEFILISLEGQIETVEIVELIRESVENATFEKDGQNIKFTISSGVAFGENHERAQDVIKSADELVYRAKEKGRNRVEIEDGKKKKMHKKTEDYLKW